ncbi:MAG: HAD family phosphatase [Pseudomonadota bacterium]
MAVQYVLFDLGNVLIDWDPGKLYGELIPDDTERTVFLRDVCNMAWHVNHDRGVSFAENAGPLIDRYPMYEREIRAWGDRWFDMFHGYVKGVPELIDRLEAANLQLYALSNVPDDVWPGMMETYDYLGRFKDVVVSGREKCVKPDPKIYSIALSRMGNPDPATVLFIDDSEKNTSAAAALRFQVHTFDTASRLETDLIDRNLLQYV